MMDVAEKLWGFCHTLRHEGVDYGDYIEQITYLLFLKMAEERGVDLPEYCDWDSLRAASGTELLDTYVEALRLLGKEPGILGDIFSGAQSRFSNPVSLKKLVGLIDETEWTALDVDVKAVAFEGLLEKAAAEGKKGAGQYFTPRLLIESIVRCMKPDPRVSNEFTIMDPACGTGGFLVAAYEWLLAQTGGAMDRDLAKRVRTQTYFGADLVARPRRLALMNLYLHQVEPHIALADSIYEAPSSQRFDVVLTNPPFGSKGANQSPERDDFIVETSNKQLNFVQHVLTVLRPGGRAAVVVPDSVLFLDQAAELFKVLMEDCDVHTVIRLPRGTFTPYTPGTKTNVLFFTKGRPTSRTWIYDGRANVPSITKISRPLTEQHFEEFERCFGSNPNGESPRAQSDSADDRWRSFSIEAIRQHGYQLESLRWLHEDNEDELRAIDPKTLIAGLIERLEGALSDLVEVDGFLDAGGDPINLDDLSVPYEPLESVLERVAVSASSTGRRATTNVIKGAGILAVGNPGGDVPTGWEWILLTRVAKMESGHTPSRKHPEYWGGDVPWITLQDAREHHGREILETREYTNELGLQNSSARLLPADTVCLSRTASVGYVVIMGRPMATSQDFVNWVCSEAVVPEFLMYALLAEGEGIRRFGRGTTHTTIYFPELKALHICLPAPAVQLEICRRVREYLGLVDRLTSRVESAEQDLGTARHVVLANALREMSVSAVANSDSH